MTLAYIGLGANLGDARQTIKDAIVCLAQHSGIAIAGRSCLYRSAPVDAGGDWFLNLVIAVETALSPTALLQLCQTTEAHFGRERPYRNAPRTLDLDILLYGDERIDTPELQIPHPRMTERAFVLVPLTEMVPDLEIPGAGPCAQFLDRVTDQPIEKVPSCTGCPCPTPPRRGDA